MECLRVTWQVLNTREDAHTHTHIHTHTVAPSHPPECPPSDTAFQCKQMKASHPVSSWVEWFAVVRERKVGASSSLIDSRRAWGAEEGEKSLTHPVGCEQGWSLKRLWSPCREEPRGASDCREEQSSKNLYRWQRYCGAYVCVCVCVSECVCCRYDLLLRW